MSSELERAEAFASDLASVYGDALSSVVLYGSAARGEYREGLSDLNFLVLLRDTAPATIRRGSAIAREWVSAGNPPPLLLSGDELRRSLDVFPIEYADIRDAHRVLHGDDVVADLQIDREHLRLQCEQELKGKQIQLRERYLLAADDPDALRDLLVRSISTFLVLFRTVLRLTETAVPPSPQQVVRATAAAVGFRDEPLLRILAARAGGETLRPDPEDPTVTGYLEAIAAAVRWVDRWSDREPPSAPPDVTFSS